jgi:hypothetical protein
MGPSQFEDVVDYLATVPGFPPIEIINGLLPFDGRPSEILGAGDYGEFRAEYPGFFPSFRGEPSSFTCIL